METLELLPQTKVPQNYSPPKGIILLVDAHSKKVLSQQPHIISKVYESSVPSTLYINNISPRKSANLKRQSKTQHENNLNSQSRHSRNINLQQNSFFQKENEDPAQQEGSFLTNPFRQPFDQEAERKKSPYFSKYQKIQENALKKRYLDDRRQSISPRKSLSERSMHQKRYQGKRSQRKNQNYLSPRSKQSNSLSKQSSHKNSAYLAKQPPKIIYSPRKNNNLRQPFGNRVNTLSQKSRNHNSPNGQNKVYNNQKIYRNKSKNSLSSGSKGSNKSSFYYSRNHLKKVTENQMELNEISSKYQNQSNQTQSHPQYLGQIQENSVNLGAKMTERESKASKRNIQDQQMRQIQQKVRKQESAEFKKGNFRVNNKYPRQILPFNIDIDPFMNTANKNRLQPSSSHKTLMHRDPRKVAERNPNYNRQRSVDMLKKKDKVIYNQQISGRANGSNQQNNRSFQRPNEKRSAQKGGFYNKNSPKHNQPSTKTSKSLNNAPNSTTFQANSNDPKNKTLFSQTIKSTPISRTESSNKLNSFNIKRNDHPLVKRRHNESNLAHNSHSQEDITKGNVIKATKLPEKVFPKVTVPKVQKSSKDTLNQAQPQANTQDGSHRLKKVSQLSSNGQPYRKGQGNTGNVDKKNSIHGKNVSSLPFNNKNETLLPENEVQGSSKDGSAGKNRHSQVSPSDTKRTIKRPNNQKSRSSASHQSERKDQVRESGQNDPVVIVNSPTIPRDVRDKNYKNKNWRESNAQRARKTSKEVKKSVSSSKPQQNSSPANNKSPLRERRSRQSKLIDPDAQEEDRFGLSAQKNVTTQKKRNVSNNASNNKNTKVKKQNESQPEQKSIRQQQEQSDDSKYEDEQQNEFSKRPEDNQAFIAPLNQQAGTLAPDINGQKKVEGVQSIQQLIEENGSLSSINDSIEESKAKDQKQGNINNSSPAMGQGVLPFAAIVPLTRQQTNLQELIKATDQVHPPKQLEPLLNQVQVDLQRHHSSKIQILQEQTEPQPGQQDMGVVLPLPIIGNSDEILTPRQSPRGENQTDCHQQLLDNIAQMPIQKQQNMNNRTQDFFQCNLKEMSKMSNSIHNITKYQNIDKDTNNYSRAPILSFLYEIPKESCSKNVKFQPSNIVNSCAKKISTAEDIDDIVIDQAVNILLSIDTWIVERIFEPFEDKDGKVGLWLYCHGNWILFREKKEQNFRTVLKKAVKQALQTMDQSYLLQSALKVISGVRIMRLKSTKKRIFNELEYSLKKGHVIKAYTSKDSKWGNRVFEVSKVEITTEQHNVLQIKQGNDKYWVKEEKFKEIFEHFLLICTRQSHFWTHRLLTHKPQHKLVVNLTSHAPTHGSITLFYPSNKPSSLLLYKELDSQVLKFMGKIEEKANQNGNLYFQFKLHGSYSLFLETPTSCLLSIQSTTHLQMSPPEYIVSQTLKNKQCEYVQISQSKSRLKDSRGLRQSRGLKDSSLRSSQATLQKLKQKFISMVVKK